MNRFKEVLSFDDVLLVPQKSDINSRSEVDLSSSIGSLEFSLPIISSPMDTVTETAMAIECHNQGGLGIIHRYNSIDNQCLMVSEIRDHFESTSDNKVNQIAAAIGVSSDLVQRGQRLFEAGARILCLDVAHGHHSLVERALKTLRDKYSDNVTLIAGNIATLQSYIELSDWGADAVRIGIGGGSICSTRIQTGHGVPTFQSVLDCSAASGASIIADGGIKKSGDIVKAFAAGADFVMLGSLLAGTTETPGQELISGDGTKRKVYRGMASVEAQKDWRGQARSLEGISTTVPSKGPASKILKDLRQNIKSGLSYSGARNLSQLRAKSIFIKQSSASQVESSTHILFS